MSNRSPTQDPSGRLLGILCDQLDAQQSDWLEGGLAAVSAAQGLDVLSGLYATAARRLATDPLGEAAAAVPTPCGSLDAGRWSRADAGRACLLAAAVARGDTPPGELAQGLFRYGDEGERVSLIRALCLIPDPCSALALAREAGRITSLKLYTALALDNPYPSACYDEHDFNGLVLKCLFNALPIGRVVGLADRANPGLSSLCEDYRDERVLAGRSVPPDIWLALVPHASTRGMALAIDALGADDAKVRRYAALALGTRRAEPQVQAALEARRSLEPDPEIAGVLGVQHPASGLQ